jgi:hypothetical protein
MGFFKKTVVKQIDGGAWGHLVNEHKMDVDTLHKMRCVEREGVIQSNIPVTFLRIFKPSATEKRGILVSGWQTFDERPELVLLEGYVTKRNEGHLERRQVPRSREHEALPGVSAASPQLI